MQAPGRQSPSLLHCINDRIKQSTRQVMENHCEHHMNAIIIFCVIQKSFVSSLSPLQFVVVDRLIFLFYFYCKLLRLKKPSKNIYDWLQRTTVSAKAYIFFLGNSSLKYKIKSQTIPVRTA